MAITKQMATPKSVSVKGKLVKLDLQHFGASTLFELKQNMTVIGQQLEKVDEELATKAMDTSATTEEITDLEKAKAGLQTRFSVIKNQHDQKEAAEKAKMNAQFKQQGGSFEGLSKEDKSVKARAEFIRAAVKPSQYKISEETQNLLHAIPGENESGGDKLLPTNMSNEIVSEPFAKNRLREVAQMSNIKGLELPRLAYQLDNDDFITDLQAAREMEVKGDTVSFGRKKFKVKVKISDTVIHGTDLELVNYVDNALRSGLAAKEKKDALASSPVADLAHMSFYSGAIAEVTGSTKYKAIKNAITALHEDFRDNAQIVMSYADYMDIIEALSNGTTDFYNAPPERVLGKNVTFSDAAVDPIVGDFNHFRINYDMTTYDTDKDVDTGQYLFVLTAWYDQQRSLDSAFRIAKIGADATPPEEDPEA